MASKNLKSLKKQFKIYEKCENFDSFFISVDLPHSKDSILTRTSDHLINYLKLFDNYHIEVTVCYKSFLKQSKLIYIYEPDHDDLPF